MNLKKRIVMAGGLIAVVALAAAAVHYFDRPVSRDEGSKGKPRDSISIVINSLGFKFPAGMDENHNPYLDYIEKNTDLDVNVLLPPNEGYEERLNYIMSSGSVPDMINVFNNVWIASYVRQNALMPLDDLIDKYGPDLKAAIPQSDWDQVRFNGKIYAIPSINENKGVELMYARKDWLDRLGLQPPRTLDEYQRVMEAFTFDDPDGNGVADTTGLLLTENLGRSSPFFGAFGIQLNQWVDRGGQLVYSNTLPETKQALQFLANLYKEKVLDPEFPLNRNPNLDKKIASGKVGLYAATWYDTRGPIAENIKNDPKAKWIPLDYPTGPGGFKGTYDTPPIREYDVIPAGAKNPADVIRFLNFIAGKGHRDLKLGFENQVWHRVNGKIVTNFAEHDKHLYRGIYESLVEVGDKELVKERLDSLGEQFHLYDNVQRIEQNLIRNQFTGIPTPAMGKYSDKLDTLQDMFTQIIVGVAPISEFDHYVEKWKREGGDEITKEVNEWYDTVKKGKSSVPH